MLSTATLSNPISLDFVLRVFLVLGVDISVFILGLCVQVNNWQFIVSPVSCYILMSVDKAVMLYAHAHTA